MEPPEKTSDVQPEDRRNYVCDAQQFSNTFKFSSHIRMKGNSFLLIIL